MKLYKITNFVIILLVITAILQTGELWLQGTDSHNFFYALMDSLQDGKKEMDGDVLLATRYAVGEGEGTFSLYYPDEVGNSDMLETANRALGEILSQKQGDHQKSVADWKEILSGRCIVMQYDFMIASEEYMENYSAQNPEENLERFDSITIVPAMRSGEDSLAYFVNSETNECLLFQAEGGGASTALYELLKTEENGIRYISTGQRTSASALWRNMFLPQWAHLPYAYAPLVREFAFEKDGEASYSLLEETAGGFFRNFSMDWSSQAEDGTFIFSDDETVVKYYPNTKVMEYFNYENHSGEERTGLLEGYQICCNFLKNDRSLKTDIYLADVQRTINNEIIYYFDYAVDNLPVHLSQPLRDSIGSPHAIEVTLRNQAVKGYRRYAVNFTQTKDKTERVNVQFIDALDDANKMYQTIVEDKDITDVKNINMGYHVDLTGSMRLKWFVTLYEYTFVVDTDQAKDLTGMAAEE
ncbi:MAG: hypothetical protein Q4C06_05850 [Bacillota bacterium]|nr:hypothetical protein [Bacillota bacterium]